LTQQIDGDLLDAAISGWLTQHMDAHLAIDLDLLDAASAPDPQRSRWTTNRCGARAGGAGVHLLAAMSHTHTGEVRTDGIVARNPA
jgi:hypothetical protein